MGPGFRTVLTGVGEKIPLGIANVWVLPMNEVTRVLSAIEGGDPHAAEQLLPLVYDELRKLAAQKLAHEKPGQTLEATALVHEAYLRLVGDQHFANRRHFFAAAARAMRRILIDSARRKQLAPRVDIEGLQLASRGADERLLELHDALDRLAKEEPTAARIVEAFQAHRNDTEWSLRLQQQDVKQTWNVQLNGKDLGRLALDENDTVIFLPI